MKMSFDQWMIKVNAAIAKKCGLTSDDLPDDCYADMYDDGLTPNMAAKSALENAGFFSA